LCTASDVRPTSYAALEVRGFDSEGVFHMASKRHIRRRSCESKVRHADFESAVAHAKRQRAVYGEIVKPYSCPRCGGWHVGRSAHSRHHGEVAARVFAAAAA
jgi:predicted RNA-binding Zn-ribbon protein involved in translation (DUF1610 family)